MTTDYEDFAIAGDQCGLNTPGPASGSGLENSPSPSRGSTGTGTPQSHGQIAEARARLTAQLADWDDDDCAAGFIQTEDLRALLSDQPQPSVATGQPEQEDQGASRDHAPTDCSALDREAERLARLELDVEAHQAIIDHFRPRFDAAFEKEAACPADRLALYPHVIKHEHTVKEWRQEIADRRATLSSAKQAAVKVPGTPNNHSTQPQEDDDDHV